MRDSDTVARIGGDEFVIVLEDLADPGDAARIVERIRAELSTPVTLEAHDIALSASIGVALNTDQDDRVEALLSRADIAMYRNKRQARGQQAALSRRVA
jgi:diguanylate cyclase (GGDEF)-like protein